MLLLLRAIGGCAVNSVVGSCCVCSCSEGNDEGEDSGCAAGSECVDAADDDDVGGVCVSCCN